MDFRERGGSALARVIAAGLLAVYCFIIIKVLLFGGFFSAMEGSGISWLGNYAGLASVRDIIKVILCKMLLFLPAGFFFPLLAGRRCLNGTLLFAAIFATVIEVLQYVKTVGNVSFGDVGLAVIGAALGYAVFLLVFGRSEYAYRRLRRRSGVQGYAVYLVVLFVFFTGFMIYTGSSPELSETFDIFGELARGISGTTGTAADDGTASAEAVPESDEIYTTIYNTLAAYGTSVSFEGIPAGTGIDTFNQQFERVFEEHPELFWLDGSGHWETVTAGPVSTITLTPGLIVDISSVPAMEQEMNAVADQIAAAAAASSADTYLQAAYVHDHLVLNCDYDMDVYDQAIAQGYSGSRNLSYTAYGCLINHLAVCEGYSKAYQLILGRLGIPCGYISGIASNELGTGPHAWNSIVLGGETYYVDVTWDDPVGNTDTEASRTYFCLTADEMAADHTPE